MHTSKDNEVPNLLRHIFPSYRVPRLGFAEGSLPAKVPPAAWCVDSTLALGRCAMGVITAEQIVDYFELVNRINSKSGLIRQAEVLVGGSVEHEALAAIIPIFKSGELQVEPVAVLPAHPVYVEPICGLGLKEVGLMFGVSDYMMLAKRTSRQGPLDRLFQTIDACIEEGVNIRLDLMDITRADIDGFVLPLLEDCVEYLNAKSKARLRVRLCDSLGLGVPWTETQVPRSVPRLLHTINYGLGLQPEQLEFVGFNDLGLALANGVTAMLHGCSGMVGCLGGIGERSGVAPLEILLIHLSGHYGVENTLRLIPEALKMLASLGCAPNPGLSLWGERALLRSIPPTPNSTVDPLVVGEPFNTGRILDLPPKLELRRESGAAGLVYLIQQSLPGTEPDCDDPALQDLMAWMEQEELDRYTWETIKAKARELLPGLFKELGD